MILLFHFLCSWILCSWSTVVFCLSLCPFQLSTMPCRGSTKKSCIEIILCSIPQGPICVSSELRFRDDPCAPSHQWFVVEAWPGYRSKCVNFKAWTWFWLQHQTAFHHHIWSTFLTTPSPSKNDEAISSQSSLCFSPIDYFLRQNSENNWKLITIAWYILSACTSWRRQEMWGKQECRVMLAGWALGKAVRKTHVLWPGLLSDPCLLLTRGLSSACALLWHSLPFYFIPGHWSLKICFGNAIIC